MGEMKALGPRLLFDKIWDAHRVERLSADYDLIYIARHMLHELGSDVAFKILEEHSGRVRNPTQTFATHDHVVSTKGEERAPVLPKHLENINALRENTDRHNIRLFDLNSGQQGIVHVIGPELGITLPGMTFVCGDSHTCTVGGLGCLGWGIGTSEVAHVLATQTLIKRRPKVFRINCEGILPKGVLAKDLILAMIAEFGSEAGANMALEFSGEAISQLSIEGRLTMCNLSIEMGARIGLVAPDDATIEFLANKPFAPSGKLLDEAIKYWLSLKSEAGASDEREESFDVSKIGPQITWGTSPAHVMNVNGYVPNPKAEKNTTTRLGMEKALDYMNLIPGQRLKDTKVDVVFIGSCTNGRLADLRAAAEVIKGQKVHPGVKALVVPGSTSTRRAAEQEGLDVIFKRAGFEWRHAGCSLCVALNGDRLKEGQRCVSTSNRNFEGRQGAGGRTHLASPTTAAASALTGRISDRFSLTDWSR